MPGPQVYGYGRPDEQVPPPQPAYYPMGNNQQQPPPPPQYGQQPPQYGQQPPQYSQQPPQYGQQPPQYGQQPPPPPQQYGVQPSQYGHQTASKYAGGYGEPAAPNVSAEPKPYDDSNYGSSFSDAAIRRGFIKKVYFLLFSQLLFTFGLICLFIFADPVREWAPTDTGMYFYISAYVLFIVVFIVLVCVKNVRRKSPANYICLGIFTLCFSYLAAMISSFHDTNIVLIAMGITALVCLGISLFAIQTKIDFTMCSGFLFVLCLVVFNFALSSLITYYTWGGSRILNCVYGALVALLFGLFLIYDTQRIFGGRRHQLSPEEYIYGALQLYVDLVYLFLEILSCFVEAKWC